MLEHIIVTQLENNLVHLKAEEGYKLHDKIAQVYRPEAITTLEIAERDFEAVQIVLPIKKSSKKK